MNIRIIISICRSAGIVYGTNGIGVNIEFCISISFIFAYPWGRRLPPPQDSVFYLC